MMLPKTPSSAPPTPVAPSAPSAAIAAPVDGDDNCPAHADYNLHPLLVRSLDHYASHDDEDERFHVS